jgi:hypothetical protein
MRTGLYGAQTPKNLTIFLIRHTRSGISLRSPVDEKEKAEFLRVLGESYRLSELSDENLVRWIVVDLFQKVAVADMQMNHIDFADMIAYALCNLGGYHRIQTCAW